MICKPPGTRLTVAAHAGNFLPTLLRDVPLDMFSGPVHKRQGKAYEYDLETKDDSEEMR